MSYAQPPEKSTADGKPRHVGVEIEFAGLRGREACRALTSALGGTQRERSPHRYVIEGSELGDLEVELDTKYAHAKDDESSTVGQARKLLGDVAQAVVPYEVITSPLTLDLLPLVDRATDALREAGALGTMKNPLFAFGVHLNPEAADLDAGYLIRVLQAFVAMNAEIRQAIRPDPSRTLLGWAEPYETEYCRRIMADDYMPDQEALIDDYIAANDGRNYDLDMLPLFAHIDEDRVTRQVDDPRINARPAFHYRLPDCRIDEKDWSIADDWNRWVAVEELAADTDALAKRRQRYLSNAV